MFKDVVNASSSAAAPELLGGIIVVFFAVAMCSVVVRARYAGRMRTRRPPVSAALLGKIETAEAMQDFVMESSPRRLLLDTDQKLVAAGLYSLVGEHHCAILWLLRTGRFDGSAFALVRPLVDGCYRALWLCFCAKPDVVRRIRAGEDCYPRFVKMTEAVERVLPGDGFFTLINKSIKHLHGYTHGGLEQVSRRFDAAGDINPSYSDGEKEEVINLTTAHVVMFGVTWCQIMGDDGRDPASGSARIMERYSEICGSRDKL